MNSTLRSGRFVAWGNAVLGGLVSPDTAAERICGRDGCHRVTGWPGAGTNPDTDTDTVTVALARLRTSGAHALRLALPVPGDTSGLPGPAKFNVEALAAGEAVLIDGPQSFGLIPTVLDASPDDCLGTAVHWQGMRVNAGAGEVTTLGEAERELTETLRAAADALDALDVARWRPEAADRISEIRSGRNTDLLAPGYPARAHRVLALAQRVAAIADLAADDDGAAFNVGGMAGRAAELRTVARAARRAQLAAYNSVAYERSADQDVRLA